MLLIIIATREETFPLKGSVYPWKSEFEFVAIFCDMNLLVSENALYIEMKLKIFYTPCV